MPTQAEAEYSVRDEPPLGDFGVGTLNVPVTDLYVPCADRQHPRHPHCAMEQTLGLLYTAPAQLFEYETWVAFEMRLAAALSGLL
jgi:hypothetical protein